MTTDNAFVLDLLERGPRTTMGIISASIQERGCGCTPHSRVADLRRAGHEIHCVRIPGGRRPVYMYALIQQPVQLELAG